MNTHMPLITVIATAISNTSCTPPPGTPGDDIGAQRRAQVQNINQGLPTWLGGDGGKTREEAEAIAREKRRQRILGGSSSGAGTADPEAAAREAARRERAAELDRINRGVPRPGDQL